MKGKYEIKILNTTTGKYATFALDSLDDKYTVPAIRQALKEI